MLQVVASPMIVILTILEVSYTLLENIYSTCVTHDDHHLQLSHFYSTDHLSNICEQSSELKLSPVSWFTYSQISNLGRNDW